MWQRQCPSGRRSVHPSSRHRLTIAQFQKLYPADYCNLTDFFEFHLYLSQNYKKTGNRFKCKFSKIQSNCSSQQGTMYIFEIAPTLAYVMYDYEPMIWRVFPFFGTQIVPWNLEIRLKVKSYKGQGWRNFKNVHCTLLTTAIWLNFKNFHVKLFPLPVILP